MPLDASPTIEDREWRIDRQSSIFDPRLDSYEQGRFHHRH